eukprot:CAMPEP_0203756856 /NCGR_PEP_ID=MMETSP0098-20131031/10052_1 /ASSEMBLY_ACC=CAM_ASM_000208 /TAXON_ID=96639 /ORGANISM=" , Strain NY0313808BC1" /LENGTH=591 /DNA_ID=CAMNT_0050648885 /DNA_START=94 /DNA_END=1865 /DNA_ORIENTATION=+
MVGITVVPSGDEVVSIEADGTESVLPCATADDAFASCVKTMQFHKRKRLGQPDDDDTMDIDGEAEQLKEEKVEIKKRKEEPENAYQHPFMDVHREIAIACYELRQLNEVTKLLCEHSLFRLENLQADERTKLSELTENLVAIEMKRAALQETLSVLTTGKEMLVSAQGVQARYLRFVQQIQGRWRMQAIAHGNFSSNLRAQEPLAVDCGFYSAGSRGKAARLRQTRNAARLIVNSDNTESDTLAVDVDESTLRTVLFAIECTDTRKCLGSTRIEVPAGSKVDDQGEEHVERQLESLQTSEFCSELFQVLSVEAVRSGELSSGGMGADPQALSNNRVKVTVVENLLDRVTVAVDAKHVLAISLVPTGVDSGTPPSVQCDDFAQDYCKVAAIVAQEHLRTVHKGIFETSLLGSLVNKYRQMKAFRVISDTLDEISKGMTTKESNLFKIKFNWTHREGSSYCEIWIGNEVLLRCKLSNGHLMLGSIAVSERDEPPPEAWNVAEQNGDQVFASPDVTGKLRTLILTIAKHEFIIALRDTLCKYLSECTRTSIETDISKGKLSWSHISTGTRCDVRVEITQAPSFTVHFQDKEITA